MISDEGKQNYLKSEGLVCPYCGSEDITNEEDFVFRGPNATQIYLRCECYDCKHVWFSIYGLVDLKKTTLSMPELVRPTSRLKTALWLFVILPVVAIIIFSLIVR